MADAIIPPPIYNIKRGKPSHCKQCGASLPPHRGTRVFCGKACNVKFWNTNWRREVRAADRPDCAWCAKPLPGRNGRRGRSQKYCSKKCAYAFWGSKNLQFRAARNRYHQVRRMYGLTPEQHDAMFVAQNGVCAICGRPPNPGVPQHRSLAVDHCHETGVVRGLLCASCNNGIGRFQDRADLLLAAATYLSRSARKKAA